MEWLFEQLQNATDRLDQEDVNLKLLLLEINSTLFLKVTLSLAYKNKVSPVGLLSFRPIFRAGVLIEWIRLFINKDETGTREDLQILSRNATSRKKK